MVDPFQRKQAATPVWGYVAEAYTGGAVRSSGAVSPARVVAWAAMTAEEGARARTATVLVNARARRASGRFDGEGAIRYLVRRGVTARLEIPTSPSGMTTAARDAALRGDEVVFVVGGDGALALAAGGLAGSLTALAAVPAGTANVFAREARIPAGFRRAIDAHLGGQVLPMDLGMAGEKPFLLMASVGWDAAIAAAVSLPLKRRVGTLAYLLQAARMLPAMRPRPARWTSLARGAAAPAYTEGRLAVMLIGNTRLYGGVAEVAHRASATDGLLDLVALCPESLGDALRLAAKAVTHGLEGDRHAVLARVAEVTIETPGLPVQADGDVIGETPMRFWVRPAALRVSVPTGTVPAVLR